MFLIGNRHFSLRNDISPPNELIIKLHLLLIYWMTLMKAIIINFFKISGISTKRYFLMHGEFHFLVFTYYNAIILLCVNIVYMLFSFWNSNINRYWITLNYPACLVAFLICLNSFLVSHSGWIIHLTLPALFILLSRS